ncbi:MAG: reverse transcriptase domain-containing protein [Acidimicrobiales bacterium]
MVLRRDEGCAFVVRSDFTDSFDRLRRDLLLDLLGRRVDDAWLLDLVRRLLERPERVNGRIVATTVGANQGGPLSPLLCNLLLTRFDDAMLGRGFPAVRYADDFAVPVPTREEADMALDLAEDKTEVLGFADGFVFLGEDVNVRYPELPRLERLDEPGRLRDRGHRTCDRAGSEGARGGSQEEPGEGRLHESLHLRAPADRGAAIRADRAPPPWRRPVRHPLSGPARSADAVARSHG